VGVKTTEAAARESTHRGEALSLQNQAMRRDANSRIFICLDKVCLLKVDGWGLGLQ
jgi:hypothetical protein